MRCNKLILFNISVILVLIGCGGVSSDSFNNFASERGNLLFVASGTCYGGGVTTSAGSGIVASYSTVDGSLERVVVDYNQFSPGDMPASITEYDKDHILVLVENTSGRRVDLVAKDGSSVRTYLVNSAALSGVVRHLERLSDGSLLVSRSTAIEKFSSAKARITQGANAYVNAPAGACATSTTLMTSAVTLKGGKILFAHAAATPNNKIGLISASGYAAAGDCLATQAAPVTTALPTALIRHSTGAILAAYGSTTSASNVVTSFKVNEVTNAITSVTTAYSDASIVNGPSAMAEDSMTGEVYIANGNSNFNNIEKMTFNPVSLVLTRAGSKPFLSNQVNTRCVTDMRVMSR